MPSVGAPVLMAVSNSFSKYNTNFSFTHLSTKEANDTCTCNVFNAKFVLVIGFKWVETS